MVEPAKKSSRVRKSVKIKISRTRRWSRTPERPQDQSRTMEISLKTTRRRIQPAGKRSSKFWETRLARSNPEGGGHSTTRHYQGTTGTCRAHTRTAGCSLEQRSPNRLGEHQHQSLLRRGSTNTNEQRTGKRGFYIIHGNYPVNYYRYLVLHGRHFQSGKRRC